MLALREQLLAEAERWIHPGSDEERAMLVQVRALPEVRIIRQPAHVLSYMRMKPRECHVNCATYVRLDPDSRTKHVLGWWHTVWGAYVLHSVVERDGVMTCITPAPQEGEDGLNFVPDELLSMVEGNDGRYEFRRAGLPVGFGLREEPESFINASEDMKRRLLAGGRPLQRDAPCGQNIRSSEAVKHRQPDRLRCCSTHIYDNVLYQI